MTVHTSQFVALTDEQQFLLHTLAALSSANIVKSKRSLPTRNLNMDILLDLASTHRVVLPIGEYIMKNNTEIPSNWKQKVAHCTSLLCLLKMELSTIFSEMQKLKIPACIIKGFAFSHHFAESVYARQFGDIDLLVKESYMPQVDKILRDCGYISNYKNNLGVYEELPYPVLKNTNHHEYFNYIKYVNGYLINVEICRYLHDNVRHDKIDGFFDNIVYAQVDGVNVPVPDYNHSLLNLLENAYENSHGQRSGLRYGVHRLRDYYDINKILTNTDFHYDWSAFFELAKHYSMDRKCALILIEVSKLFALQASGYRVYRYIQEKYSDLYTSSNDTPEIVERIFNINDIAAHAYYKNIYQEIIKKCNPNEGNCYTFNYSETSQHHTIGLRISSKDKDLVHILLTGDINIAEYFNDHKFLLQLLKNDANSTLSSISFLKRETKLICIGSNYGYVSEKYGSQPRGISSPTFEAIPNRDEQNNALSLTLPVRMLLIDDVRQIKAIKLIVTKRIYHDVFHTIYPSENSYSTTNNWHSVLLSGE